MVKFCSSCGSNLSTDTKFCPNCGAPVGQGNTEVPTSAAPQMNANVNNTYVAGAKSKMVAGLLGIFLGAWGIHNFYLGYSGKAILQIVLTIITCGIAGIWGFIEGILILCGNINTDADGNTLVD